MPGRVGWLLRNAYYKLLLRSCAWNCCLEFGSILHHSEAELGDRVYLGLHSTIGEAKVGHDTIIADFVQILSGRHQHGTDLVSLHQQQPVRFQEVLIGSNCWIGAHAIVMADVGDNSIIHRCWERCDASSAPAKRDPTLALGLTLRKCQNSKGHYLGTTKEVIAEKQAPRRNPGAACRFVDIQVVHLITVGVDHGRHICCANVEPTLKCRNAKHHI